MSGEQEARIYDRCIVRVCKLEAENERLRKMVRELSEFVSRAEWLQEPELRDLMRELGIEVTS